MPVLSFPTSISTLTFPESISWINTEKKNPLNLRNLQDVKLEMRECVWEVYVRTYVVSLSMAVARRTNFNQRSSILDIGSQPPLRFNSKSLKINIKSPLWTIVTILYIFLYVTPIPLYPFARYHCILVSGLVIQFLNSTMRHNFSDKALLLLLAVEIQSVRASGCLNNGTSTKPRSTTSAPQVWISMKIGESIWQ